MTFRKNELFGVPSPRDVSLLKDRVEACDFDKVDDMPGLYHGCLSRGFLERVAGADGTYVCSTIPDIYFNFRALQAETHWLHCDHPFSIRGHSPASTGTSQNARNTAGSSGDPGRRFGTEIETDPIRDVIPYALSVPLVFLSTLETIRARFPEPALNPDYTRWYAYVLRDAARKEADVRREVETILADHAERTGTGDALTAARKVSANQPDKWRRRLRKIAGRLQSFRVVTANADENTVATAASVADDILRDDYARLADSGSGRDEVWPKARVRSKAYRRVS